MLLIPLLLQWKGPLQCGVPSASHCWTGDSGGFGSVARTNLLSISLSSSPDLLMI